MDKTPSYIFYLLLNNLFFSEICHIAYVFGCKQPFTLTLLFFISQTGFILKCLATRQIDSKRERESCWVIYQRKWSPELMTKNEREGKRERGKAKQFTLSASLSPTAIWEPFVKTRGRNSTVLANRDDLLSWYQCPHTPEHKWHMGNLKGLPLYGFANIFSMIHVCSQNYGKIFQ